MIRDPSAGASAAPRLILALAMTAALGSLASTQRPATTKPGQPPTAGTGAGAGAGAGARARPAPAHQDIVERRYGRRSSDQAKRQSAIAGSTGAANSGLQWLAAHQSADGRWSGDKFMALDQGEPCDGAARPGHDIGLTGLALLAFLGAGNTEHSGPHRATVAKAVAFLGAQQDPRTGQLGTGATHTFIYSHAIATYALVEAGGLQPIETTRAVAQKALDYLATHRNPYAVWRYQPRDNDNDISVTNWAMMAYAAGLDFDFKVERSAARSAARIAATYLDQLTEPGTGRVGYTRRGSRSSRHMGKHAEQFPPDQTEALTAVGTWLRLILRRNLGELDRSTEVEQALELIRALPPTTEGEQRVDYYYWMFASHVMFQAGGLDWQRWAHALSSAVVMRQRRNGNAKGSWDPDCAWGVEGGRVYSTAMAVLMLQAEYRYARWLRPAAPAATPDAKHGERR